jgi:hypothetical protein
MTENDYSTDIKKAIVQFARSCKGKYSSVREEQKIWLKAPHKKTSFYQFPYKPEVCLTQTAKDGGQRHVIFEVLDSQLKNPNLIIADLIQALLVEDAWRVVFIAPHDKGYEMTKELSELYGGLLTTRLVDAIKPFLTLKSALKTIKEVVKEYGLPEVAVYKVSKEEASNPKKLRVLLSNWSKKDGW